MRARAGTFDLSWAPMPCAEPPKQYAIECQYKAHTRSMTTPVLDTESEARKIFASIVERRDLSGLVSATLVDDAGNKLDRFAVDPAPVTTVTVTTVSSDERRRKRNQRKKRFMQERMAKKKKGNKNVKRN